jgi:hypothetical protein
MWGLPVIFPASADAWGQLVGCLLPRGVHADRCCHASHGSAPPYPVGSRPRRNLAIPTTTRPTSSLSPLACQSSVTLGATLPHCPFLLDAVPEFGQQSSRHLSFTGIVASTSPLPTCAGETGAPIHVVVLSAEPRPSPCFLASTTLD